ncbi:hypothetical protein EVAR_32910_1 [Eumeta japonica]|uniref:Uncharacterized protein n=1 Tax=Eumeta variegata TaxID=151549 RepID=A0A4C2A2P5_EUMVA|nr:hypothetical protein EVAR_32910_1 [Eumeta japonica]
MCIFVSRSRLYGLNNYGLPKLTPRPKAFHLLYSATSEDALDKCFCALFYRYSLAESDSSGIVGLEIVSRLVQPPAPWTCTWKNCSK